jgi:Mrp family chromosome partitioning ATPase
VTIHSASGPEDLVLEIPGGISLAKLLPHLVAAVELPLIGGDERAVRYEIVHLNRCIVLNKSVSLLANKVVTGDELVLVAFPPSQAEDDQWAEQSDADAVLNGGRAEWGQPTKIEFGVSGDDRGAASDRAQRARTNGLVDREGWKNSRIIVVGSGPAGGTGRTVVAMGLAIAATERGCRTILMGIAGPGLAIYLGLPRGADRLAMIESKDAPAVTTQVKWQAGRDVFQMEVMAEAADWSNRALVPGQITAMLTSCRESYDLVIIDFPPVGPGLVEGTLELLQNAQDLLLIVPPSAMGVAAVVDGLAYLKGSLCQGREAPRVALALNQRTPGGLSLVEFTTAITRVWGSCPYIAAEIGYSPELARALDRGEILRSGVLSKPMAELAEVLLGSST